MRSADGRSNGCGASVCRKGSHGGGVGGWSISEYISAMNAKSARDRGYGDVGGQRNGQFSHLLASRSSRKNAAVAHEPTRGGMAQVKFSTSNGICIRP